MSLQTAKVMGLVNEPVEAGDKNRKFNDNYKRGMKPTSAPLGRRSRSRGRK